jgi:uncharacterized protein
MSTFFLFFYDLFSKRRLLFFLLLGATIGLIIYTALKIKLSEDISKVLPRNEKVDQYLQVVNQSAFADELVIYIGPANPADSVPPEQLMAIASIVADSVRANMVPALVANLRDQADESMVSGVWDDVHANLPIYLDDEDFRGMESLTSDSAIDAAILNAYKSLTSPMGMVTRKYILKDPLGLTNLGLKKIQAFTSDESYRTVNGYVFSKDKKYLLMFLSPAQKSTETAKNAKVLKNLDRYFAAATKESEGKIKAGYFGSMAISVANADQLKRDIMLTMSLAVVLLILFIGFYFGNFSVIPPIVLTTLMSAGMSVAVLALMGREISAVSLGFGAVLLGIAIAYAIHYLNHLRDEGNGRNIIKEIALPIVMSAIISSGDFFTLLLVRSDAVKDLGLFAGFSILAAGLFNLIFLPHLTKKINWNHSRENLINRTVYRIAAFPVEKVKWMLPVVLLLTVVFFFTSRKVTFEGDLTGMSHMTPQLKESEATLDRISQYTLRSVFVVTKGKTLDEALENTEKLVQKAEQLKADGLVRRFSDITQVAIPTGLQQERIDRWNAFWTPEKIAATNERLNKTAAAYGFKPGVFDGFAQWLQSVVVGTLHATSLPAVPPPVTAPYITTGPDITTVTTILKVRQDDKPQVYEALQGQQDSFIFDKQYLTSTFMDILNQDFNKLVLVSLLIVFLVLLISYGRIELATITFIPMFLSWVWTLGIMGLFGIKLNIFNMIITSFVFGLGIDYALFSIQGMLQEYKHGHGHVDSYRSSVLMDAMTTLLGLGVLIFAVHPALRSMAYAAIIGIVSVWFVTWSLEPVLFRWLVYSGGKKRPYPVNLKDFLFAISSLTIFVVGSVILLVYAFIIFKILRVKKGPLKGSFHWLMMILSRSLIYANFLSPKHIIGKKEANLRKPAVLIANHQSHIDIALVLMEHPRLLELTNNRVQHSFLYGPLVQMAEFYDVSDGMESLAKKLKKNVEQGYSVLVFPEGTRSPDTHVQRFHQGAFYLAKQLNVDILPVIIHGSGPIFPKGEYFLRTGVGTIKFLPRISPDDKRFGESTLEISRNIRKYMAEEYRKVAMEVEKPSYFRERLVKNYLFKGPVLEWYLKVKIRLEKDYALFHKHLPMEGHITDIGCGYGFMSYMLSFLSGNRTFTGIDYDEEKIETANHVPAKNDRLHFVHGDVLHMELPVSRAFILADVLHYFPEYEQEKLIDCCVKKLEEGGVMMIRDGDRQMEQKHFGTRLSEFFSTRLGFNQTRGEDKKLFFTSKENIMKILKDRGLEVEIVDETKMTSNLVYIARKSL